MLAPDVVWRPVAIVVAVGLAFTLLWRRTQPLAMVALAFGTVSVLDIAAIVLGAGASVGLITMVYLLVLPYALLRWGSGREIVLGLSVALFAYALGIASDPTGLVDAVAALVFFMFPAVVGATVRIWTSSRVRAIEQATMRERAQLARELHDTVAHHVSAIVVRAQAGRVVARSRPEAPLEALEVIEEEGARTLAEMRAMIGALREREAAELAPQPGVMDLQRLARQTADLPRVEVQLGGELDDLGAPLGAAIYRIAQESVTNAVRHARHATRVVVQVVGEEDCVRVTVCDDGAAGAGAPGPARYGLVGMTERATLLGGTLEAGPGPDTGWTVSAVLPRRGPSR